MFDLFQRMFLDHGSMMLLVEPDTGSIIKANYSAARFYGISLEELLLKTTRDISCNPPEFTHQRDQFIESGELTHFFSQHWVSGREKRDVEVNSSPIKTKDGKILLFSIMNDVTEQKRNEEILKESENQFKSLFRALKDLIDMKVREIDCLYNNKTTPTLPDISKAIEKHCIEDALRKSRGTIQPAAKSLEIHRNVLIRLMAKMGISASKYKSVRFKTKGLTDQKNRV